MRASGKKINTSIANANKHIAMLTGRYFTVIRNSLFVLLNVKWQIARRFMINANKGSPKKMTGIKYVRN